MVIDSEPVDSVSPSKKNLCISSDINLMSPNIHRMSRVKLDEHKAGCGQG